MAEITIGMDEWLAELSRLSIPKGPDGQVFATADIVGKACSSACIAQRRIREAVHLGVLEFAGKQLRPTICGGMQSVPVYRVKKHKKK